MNFELLLLRFCKLTYFFWNNKEKDGYFPSFPVFNVNKACSTNRTARSDTMDLTNLLACQ